MHKNDPYIFPLAFQESQNRQRLRMNQQAAQGMQQQPKVNEQALAQMAPPQAQPMPEDQGIGGLGAPNMETMADGGIAGYPDDDFVTRNQSVVMMAEGGQVPRYQSGGMPQFVQDIMGIPQMYTDYQQRIREEDERKAESDRRMAQRRQEQLAARQKTSFANYLFGSPEREAEGKAQLAELSAPTPDKQQAEFIRQQDKLMERRVPRRQGDEFEAEEKMVADRAAKPPVVAPAAAPARKDGPARKDPSARPAAGPSTTGQFDVAAMMKSALEEAEKKPDPLEARLKEINAAKETQAKENVSGLEAIQKQFADIYKGRKDRLDTREGEIGKMKDQSLGLALLNAGAAMMQTRGSVGQAAGAGIDKFSQQYVAGLDKINSAKDKLNEARDRLEEIESQRGELSARELHKARNEVKSITTAGMEDLVRAAMAERKMNRTEAIAFVTAQLNANLKLYEVNQRSKDTQAVIAARGDTAGTKQDRLKLDGLKALATTLTNEIKNDPMLGLKRNAPQKQAKEAELARVKDQIAQLTGLGTMAPASPAGAGSGLDLSQWGKSQVVNE
jgi:hypothetical protein